MHNQDLLVRIVIPNPNDTRFPMSTTLVNTSDIEEVKKIVLGKQAGAMGSDDGILIEYAHLVSLDELRKMYPPKE